LENWERKGVKGSVSYMAKVGRGMHCEAEASLGFCCYRSACDAFSFPWWDIYFAISCKPSLPMNTQLTIPDLPSPVLHVRCYCPHYHHGHGLDAPADPTPCLSVALAIVLSSLTYSASLSTPPPRIIRLAISMVLWVIPCH
jgi:hypothetical protein